VINGNEAAYQGDGKDAPSGPWHYDDESFHSRYRVMRADSGYQMARVPRSERTVLEIVGVVDESRRLGFLMLADRLMRWGLDGILVSVEKVDSIDTAGAVALLDMMTHLRSSGTPTHLAVGPKGLCALLAAGDAGRCGPLRCSVNYWMDVPN
jgi:ABC-type transporter Mla MlaB component